jgi:hypothetical protein
MQYRLCFSLAILLWLVDGLPLRRAVASGDVRKVVANIVPENAASAKVVSRLGFPQDRTLAFERAKVS